MNEEQLKEIGISDDVAPKILELHTSALTEREDQLKNEIAKATRTAYGNNEEAVLMATKIEKKDGEQTSDYIKRAVQEKEHQIAAERDQKIQDLEEKIKGGNTDQALKDELEILRKEKEKMPEVIEEKVGEWKSKYENLFSEYEGYKQESLLRSQMPGKFKEGADHDYIEFKMSQAIEKAKGYKISTDEKGNVILLNEENYDRVNAKEFFKEELKNILPGDPPAGGGAGKGQPTVKDGVKVYPDDMSENDKIHAIQKDMYEAGFKQSNVNQWQEEYRKRAEANGLIKKSAK
jgi:hypothetical protein